MPSVEQIKQYLATVILPVLAGVAANWLFVHLSWFAAIGIDRNSVAGVITQLGVTALTAVFAWLGAHHILSGNYTPAAKAAQGRK